MGFIGFALKGNYKRHYKNLKKVSQKTGKSTILMFIDTAVSALVLLVDYARSALPAANHCAG